MTEQQQTVQQRIQELEEQISQLEREAVRLTRELESVENQGAQGSAVRGELQEKNLILDDLRLRLNGLRTEQAQTNPPPAQPPEHAPVAGDKGIAIGGMVWVAQEGGVSTHLRTHPHFERGEDKARLTAGMQCTVVDGPEHEQGYTWWRVRTTDGDEGWLPDEGLMSQGAL
jgi:small-conductance mechanosensitive channel